MLRDVTAHDPGFSLARRKHSWDKGQNLKKGCRLYNNVFMFNVLIFIIVLWLCETMFSFFNKIRLKLLEVRKHPIYSLLVNSLGKNLHR